MATREDLRARLVPGIARLARSRDFRTPLGRLTDGARTQTIIVVLPDDHMGYIFDRLRDAGGFATVAMPRGDGAWEIAVMWPASAARLAVAEEDDTVSQIHEHSRADMFFDYLARVRTTVVQCVAAQLVDQGELQLS